MTTVWTPQKTEQLKNLHEQGLTGQQISDRFGDVSRNAVIGKIHRLQLTRRKRGARMGRKTNRCAAPIDLAFREAINIPLAELTRDKCHLICSAPGMPVRYCGRPVKYRSSWCPFHHKQLHREDRW